MNLFQKAKPQEIRPVPGMDGYEVDAFGNVYSTRKGGERRRLRPGLAGNGYLTVSLYQKSYAVHAVVRMAFMPAAPGLVINHKDGNKLNNRVENLELVSSSDNNRHALSTGLRKPTSNKGESVGTSRLTSEQVRNIKAQLVAGESCASIATNFHVDRTTVSKIKNRNTWNHI